MQLVFGLDRESKIGSSLKFSNYVRKEKTNSVSCSKEYLNILFKVEQLEKSFLSHLCLEAYQLLKVV